MTKFAKIALTALSLAVAGAGTAQAQQVELITAIGFGQTKAHAQMTAVKQWVMEGSRMYGWADWNTALRGEMECFKIDPSGAQYSTKSIVVGGDVTQPWSCSVTGLPLSAISG